MKLKASRLTKKSISPSSDSALRIIILTVTIILLILIWIFRSSLLYDSKLGLLGIFFINFFASASVVVPLPGIASVFLSGAILDPISVGLASGIGASLGELFGYFLGFGGRGLVKSMEDEKNWIENIEFFFNKAGFVTTFIFSALPVPIFDIIGILAGSLNYPIWKFFTATLLGRTLRNILIAWTGEKFLPV